MCALLRTIATVNILKCPQMCRKSWKIMNFSVFGPIYTPSTDNRLAVEQRIDWQHAWDDQEKLCAKLYGSVTLETGILGLLLKTKAKIHEYGSNTLQKAMYNSSRPYKVNCVRPACYYDSSCELKKSSPFQAAQMCNSSILSKQMIKYRPFSWYVSSLQSKWQRNTCSYVINRDATPAIWPR